MKTISVSELHERTAEWIHAVRKEPLLIMEGGNPGARLERWPDAKRQTLLQRKLRPGFAQLAGQLGSKKGADVTRDIAEDREQR